jgi:hypothetical protein
MGVRIKRGIAVAAALVCTTVGAVVGLQSSGSATTAPRLQAYGIAGAGTLMLSFQTDTPEQNDWVRRVTGLSGDTALVGIDFRVQDGKLYGVGNRGGIYIIGIPTAVVTKVSQLSVALYGSTFGVDFNPAADRLRVISDNGQNLRHNLADHTTVADAVLTTPPAVGATYGVTAAAYTNNDLDADTATTLFDINTATDQVVIQSPANNGLLVPTGKLGVGVNLDAGFDIFSKLSNGKTIANAAFAALAPAKGSATLFGVDLLTGAANSIGVFPLDVTDVAVALDKG